MTHDGQTGFYVDHDGVRLVGTLFLAAGTRPKPTVMLLHGIPGIEKNFDIALMLRDRGWNTIIFHDRGCWGSSGDYDLHKIPNDVLAVLDSVKFGSNKLIDQKRIFLVGHSLGGWAAVLTAGQEPNIRGVAAVSAVSDNDSFPLADPGYAAGYSPWLSGMTPETLAQQWATIGEAFSPLAQAHKIPPRPFLIIHSMQDQEVPISNSYKLAKAAGELCKVITHPDANHSFTWHRQWLRETLFDWLEKANSNTQGDIVPNAKTD